MKNKKVEQRIRRRMRIRAKIEGTAKIPRVSVFRSNKYIFVQFIDDSAGKTMISNIIKSKDKGAIKGNKTEIASAIGGMLAKKAQGAGISQVVFDRGGYKYHGRIKALADGLRKGGLKF